MKISLPCIVATAAPLVVGLPMIPPEASASAASPACAVPNENAAAASPKATQSNVKFVPEFIIEPEWVIEPWMNVTTERSDIPNDPCFIRAYRGSYCTDMIRNYAYAHDKAWEAWAAKEHDYCRLCKPFDDAHSFSVHGNCGRWVTMKISDDSCGQYHGQKKISGDVSMLGTRPDRCVNVDTGLNWRVGFPCYAGPYSETA